MDRDIAIDAITSLTNELINGLPYRAPVDELCAEMHSRAEKLHNLAAEVRQLPFDPHEDPLFVKMADHLDKAAEFFDRQADDYMADPLLTFSVAGKAAN